MNSSVAMQPSPPILQSPRNTNASIRTNRLSTTKDAPRVSGAKNSRPAPPITPTPPLEESMDTERGFSLYGALRRENDNIRMKIALLKEERVDMANDAQQSVLYATRTLSEKREEYNLYTSACKQKKQEIERALAHIREMDMLSGVKVASSDELLIEKLQKHFEELSKKIIINKDYTTTLRHIAKRTKELHGERKRNFEELQQDHSQIESKCTEAKLVHADIKGARENTRREYADLKGKYQRDIRLRMEQKRVILGALKSLQEFITKERKRKDEMNAHDKEVERHQRNTLINCMAKKALARVRAHHKNEELRIKFENYDTAFRKIRFVTGTTDADVILNKYMCTNVKEDGLATSFREAQTRIKDLKEELKMSKESVSQHYIQGDVPQVDVAEVRALQSKCLLMDEKENHGKRKLEHYYRLFSVIKDGITLLSKRMSPLKVDTMSDIAAPTSDVDMAQVLDKCRERLLSVVSTISCGEDTIAATLKALNIGADSSAPADSTAEEKSEEASPPEHQPRPSNLLPEEVDLYPQFHDDQQFEKETPRTSSPGDTVEQMKANAKVLVAHLTEEDDLGNNVSILHRNASSNIRVRPIELFGDDSGSDHGSFESDSSNVIPDRQFFKVECEAMLEKRSRKRRPRRTVRSSSPATPPNTPPPGGRRKSRKKSIKKKEAN